MPYGSIIRCTKHLSNMSGAAFKLLTKHKANAARHSALWSQISGIVPFYKESGTHPTHVRDWMKLHLEEEFDCGLRSSGIEYTVVKSVEMPFAGVCFLVMGRKYYQYLKFYYEMDTEQDMDLLLGISTDNNVLRPDVESVVTNRSDVKVSYDELYFNIKRKLEYTHAIMTCDANIVNKYFTHVIDKHIWRPDEKWYQRGVNGNYSGDGTDVEDENKFEGKQRLRNSLYGTFDERFAITKLRAVRILNYDPPHLKLRVEANARLKPKTFVSHLKKVLGIDCVVTASNRTKFGPVTADDCIRKHEMYFKEMKEKSDEWTHPIMSYIQPQIQKSVLKKENKRLRH